MPFDDWNHDGTVETEESIAVNDTNVFAGNTALQVDASPTGAHVWQPSLADAPTEARVVSYIYPARGATNEILFEFFFRYQDLNNYYVVSVYTDNDRDARISLGTEIAGVPAVRATAEINTLAWSSTTLSDGENPLGNWNKWRVTLWVDAQNDDIRARIEEDADEDGTWSQIGPDLVDQTVRLSGGGVGLGVSPNGAKTNIAFDDYLTWYDETEVRY